jgi:hypothetical protein
MFPACDKSGGAGVCAKCTASSHALCMDQTPHCDNHECVACVDDRDCEDGTGVCMPSGGCAASTAILHARSNANGSSCTAASPCSLDTAFATAKTGTTKIIKLDDPGPYQSTSTYAPDVDVSMALTIDARNATIHRNGGAPIFTINDDKGLTILGGVIEGPTGGTTEGIRCGNRASFTAYGTTIKLTDGPAISAPNGCTLTLVRSQILSNPGGGLTIMNGKFIIVGNTFLGNGNSGSPNSAVTISALLDDKNRLEFNTIANNTAQTGVTGLDCKAGIGFAARNNIIWSNSGALQITGNCLHSYSVIGPTPAIGMSNISDPPMLTADGHLETGSSAIRKADPGAILSDLVARDIDGDMRIAPADIGADQVPRP